jgi:hypothetical protein
MNSLWDYNKNELEKVEEGRIKILERKINYGPDRGEKINLSDVKKYWKKLHLFTLQKRLLELLLWGKYNSTQKNNNSSLRK